MFFNIQNFYERFQLKWIFIGKIIEKIIGTIYWVLNTYHLTSTMWFVWEIMGTAYYHGSLLHHCSLIIGKLKSCNQSFFKMQIQILLTRITSVMESHNVPTRSLLVQNIDANIHRNYSIWDTQKNDNSCECKFLLKWWLTSVNECTFNANKYLLDSLPRNLKSSCTTLWSQTSIWYLTEDDETPLPGLTLLGETTSLETFTLKCV